MRPLLTDMTRTSAPLAPPGLLKSLSLALSALLLASCAISPPPPATDSKRTDEPVKVKVIAFNDFHGNLRTPSTRVLVADATQPSGFRQEPAGGIEQFAQAVADLRTANPNSVVVSAGDMLGATPLLSALFKDEPTIEAMNLVGVDFHAVGNHEFDYGVAHLKRMRYGGCAIDAKTKQPDCAGRPPFAGAKFEFLAANTIVDGTNETLFPATGIRSFEGVKVGFIGMTLQGTAPLVRPGGTTGVSFRDEVETVKSHLPALRAQGANTIVVVVHEGGAQSGDFNSCKDFVGAGKELALRLPPEVDVVVQAHSHRHYICPDIGGKLVTSAGSNGTALTEIDLTLDRASGKVRSKSARNVLVRPDGPKAAPLTALLNTYVPLAAPLENRVVARVSRELPIWYNEHGESALGNLIADAHLAATQAPERGGAVIAFNNPGSLRAPVIPDASGGVTYGALFRTQPFQNDLVVMNLTGAQIKQLLEEQFDSSHGKGGRLLGVSRGFSYSWDPSKPFGDRIIADSLRLNGRAIQRDLQYRITANGFMAGGNEGLNVMLQGTDRQVSVGDLEALVMFLEPTLQGSPYQSPAMDRINRRK